MSDYQEDGGPAPPLRITTVNGGLTPLQRAMKRLEEENERIKREHEAYLAERHDAAFRDLMRRCGRI